MKKIIIFLLPTISFATDGLPGAQLPSADVLPLGHIRLEASFTDHQEGNYHEAYDYAIGVGATEDLSISFRLSDRRPEGRRYLDNGRMSGNRDLSSYIRYRVYDGNDLDVTFGADDILGLAKNFSKVYGVASFDLNNSFAASAGISKPLCDRCEDLPISAFGKLEYKHPSFNLGIGYNEANETWSGSIQKSFGNYTIASSKTKNANQFSISWTGRPYSADEVGKADSVPQTKLMMQPIYSTAIGTEYGVVDFSLGVRAKLSAPINEKLSFQWMQDVPLYNTLKYRDGEYYESRQLEGRTHFLGLSAVPSDNVRLSYGFSEAEGDFSPTLQLNYQSKLTQKLKLSTRNAIIAKSGGAKLLSQSRLNYLLPWDKWEAYLEYGRYYYGDAGTRFGFQNSTASLTYGGEISYINDIDYSASLFLSLALPSKEIQLGNLKVGLEDSIGYQMTTTLADPLQEIFPSLKNANRQQPNRMRTDGYVFGLFD